MCGTRKLRPFADITAAQGNSRGSEHGCDRCTSVSKSGSTPFRQACPRHRAMRSMKALRPPVGHPVTAAHGVKMAHIGSKFRNTGSSATRALPRKSRRDRISVRDKPNRLTVIFIRLPMQPFNAAPAPGSTRRYTLSSFGSPFGKYNPPGGGRNPTPAKKRNKSSLRKT